MTVEADLSGDLDGGTFGFTLPMGWAWIVFILGAILFVAGFALAFSSSGEMLPGLSAVGALLMGFSAPTKLQRRLQELRSQLRPAEVQWQAEAGGTELQSFWNSATVHRPTVDHRSWVFPAPGPDNWHLENRYAPDEGGELLPEHPNRIGTPRPPMVSNYGLATMTAFALFALQFWMLVESGETPYLVHALIGIAAIWLIISFFGWRRSQSMQDTPTSNIRSAAVGTGEIVGQVRPGPFFPPTVVVDGDNSKSVDNLVSWRWTYEIYVCRRETYTDSEGNTQTKEVCEWRQIRADNGGSQFTIHDGTGGMAVNPNSFSAREYGDHLIQWECRHDMRIRGLFTNLFMDGDIRRHRWTLWGLKIGDPCYMLATMKTRSHDALNREDVPRTIQNALLEAVGEKAPQFKPRLEKGTELTALAGVRSQLEYLIIPTLALLAAISMLAL